MLPKGPQELSLSPVRRPHVSAHIIGVIGAQDPA